MAIQSPYVVKKERSEQRKQSQREPPKQQDNSVGSCVNNDHAELWKEVENLKTDKIALMLELVKLRQFQETADNKMLRFKDRLQGMEKSRQQLLSPNNGDAQLIQPKENNQRVDEAGNMIEQVAEDGEPPMATDHMIVRYQPPKDETSKPVVIPSVSSQKRNESDNLSDGTKDFWMNIDFAKVLLDESHTPFIPLDLHGGGAWIRE
ncbi:hypothetical protein V6N11_010309 [Hibiscus sabdariffa]|uniref:Uncharacterized protein n=1 Tax=Hibiscus sabdariffa TaxID=183260 RepID=A0ABR2PEL0_9ROSI